MKNNDRINGFDALRTIAMWLGIVLHSIIAYKVIDEANWPHDPEINIPFLDWLFDYIHIFRMPLFFLVAGFFARMVITRSGIRYFITQRFKRIVIPFVIGVIVIVPFTLLPFFYYMSRYEQQLSEKDSWHYSLTQMFHWNGLAHLWFLYYLIFFYFLSVIFKWLLAKKGFQPFSKFHAHIEKISILKLSVAVLFLAVILMTFRMNVPPIYTGIRLSNIFILYYGFFYAIGWLLQINIKSIASLTNNCITLFIVGTGISVLHYFTHYWYINGLNYFLSAVQTISLIAGITGLVIKYCHAESKLWRYCSDASYWIYLVHMGIVGAMQVALLNSSVPGVLKLPLVLLTTFTISLLSYHFLVRYTIIGEYLHGRRVRNK